MNDHHLILGTLEDFLTGREIPDTHDERYRQKIAQFLVTSKGYAKNDIRSNIPLTITIPGKKAIIQLDFIITLTDYTAMIIKYGPGSIITRHRPSLAASRILTPYQIPVIVVTNGEDADVIDGITGTVTGSGFNAIPDRKSLSGQITSEKKTYVTESQAEGESRILFAFEVDGSCPCDSSICRI